MDEEVVGGSNPVLSSQQRQVLYRVQEGASVFFTGPAGSGKSVLLRAIIENLKKKYSAEDFNDYVAVTAPTGIAALNIGGRTIHSWAGIGRGQEGVDVLERKTRGRWAKWRAARALIIDEISMLDGTLFDKLEYLARKIRENSRPFGGIQLVICGDFFQLPPVREASHQHRKPAVFAFQSKTFQSCIGPPVFLTKVFRQRDDRFVKLLTNMRYGCLSPLDIAQLGSLSRPLKSEDGFEPTMLFPVKSQVDDCNRERLSRLPEEPNEDYYAMDSAGSDVKGEPLLMNAANDLIDRLVASRAVSLRIGAQVMLIKNHDQELVNGSIGKVVDFLTIGVALERELSIMTNPPRSSEVDLRDIGDHMFQREQRWPLVEFNNSRRMLCPATDFTCEGIVGNVEARRIQIPLILAWAISIHKSQGQTLDRVRVDLARIFEKGQVYVALSRATSMEGLQIDNFDPAKVEADIAVLSWHKHWTQIHMDKSSEWNLDESLDIGADVEVGVWEP